MGGKGRGGGWEGWAFLPAFDIKITVDYLAERVGKIFNFIVALWENNQLLEGGAFVTTFGIKITLDYRLKKSKYAWYYKLHFGEENNFGREGVGELKKY